MGGGVSLEVGEGGDVVGVDHKCFPGGH
jgi:hypothetical protein